MGQLGPSYNMKSDSHRSLGVSKSGELREEHVQIEKTTRPDKAYPKRACNSPFQTSEPAFTDPSAASSANNACAKPAPMIPNL